MHTFTHVQLQRISVALFERAGSAPEEANRIAEHLVAANLKGHDSHGVGMIPNYIRNLKAGTMNPNTGVTLVRDAGAVMQFDGGVGYGQRVGAEMMEQLIVRARETGAVVAALRNVYHLGRIGTYAEMGNDAGLVSMHFVNAIGIPPTVAPYRGSDARFSTNPISIGIPGTANSEPVVVDMATSIVAMGKVRVAFNKGEQMEPGMLVDNQGRPTTEPGVMYPPEGERRGALMPFGLHKGYCLLIAAEMLAGAIGGGGIALPDKEHLKTIRNGMLTVVIDPAALSEPEWREREIDLMHDYVKSSPPGDPDAPVLFPGDVERASLARRMAEGIPVDPVTWNAVLDAGEQVGLPRSEVEALLSNA